MKTQIILDTNFLLIPGQFKVDIFSEIERLCSFSYELCIMQGTEQELRKITLKKDEKGANKTAAKIGLKLVEDKKVKEIEFESLTDCDANDVDSKILQYCGQQKGKTECIVATQDAELAKKLRIAGIRLIRLRKLQYLEITQ